MKYAYILLCFFCFSAFGQKKDSLSSVPKKDSLYLKRSEDFYRNLQVKSKNSQFTKMLHSLMFEPVNPANEKETIKKIESQLNRNFKEYQGKIIRKIQITTLDPFGYNEKDTTVSPQKGIDKMGNALHASTKPFTVRGLLLIKKNKPVDSLKILETERLLRQRKFIRRAIIRPEKITNITDSIDLHVYVLDSWSLDVDGDISTSKGELRLREYNFFGLGHQVTTTYKQDFQDQDKVGFTLGYRARNLYNTFIDAEVLRDVETNQSYRNLASLTRTFYSPYARWAGEISMQQRYYYENFYNTTTDSVILDPIKTKTLNIWGGYAIPIANKNSKEKLPTNLVLAARYSKLDYIERPNEQIDSVAYFSNENVALGSIGVRNINYVRDRYIFRNGDIEDIAIGNSYFIHSGIQRSPYQNNFYFGVDLTFSNYYKDFGYLAASTEYGSYFNSGDVSRSVFKFEGTYFSPIFTIGNWYMRQFVKSNVVVGINRKEIIKDRIDLDGDRGIQGFNSQEVYGTRKFVFSFQTQSYVPFSWLGFRMSPFISFDLGFIGEEPRAFFSNDLYSRFGAGFLISNDYFVFDTIKLSFSVYPSIPGQGENIMKFNGNYDNLFNLDDYNYEEPHIVEYQ